MKVTDLARAERADLLAFLRTLTPAQWESPSLCEGWSVRDVVAHIVSYDGIEPQEIVARMKRARFSPNGLNATGVEEFRSRPPDELVELLAAGGGMRGLPEWLGGRVALTDTLVHHQDIRRPLALLREIPPERLLAALRFAVFAPPLRGFWHGRGSGSGRPTSTGASGAAPRRGGRERRS